MTPKSVTVSSALRARKQKRALRTRQELLKAARAIFARDGFEHARIEDISNSAEKTRGAFYDHFKGKEDAFFAIFEESMDRDSVQLRKLLEGLSRIEQRIVALSSYLCELSKDRQRLLLNLEFKLYAIRHPRKRKRLAALLGAMSLRGPIPELNRLMPQLVGKKTRAQPIDSLAVCGILDGLALNHLFDPDAFGEAELARYMNLCLRETLSQNLS